MMTGNPSSTYLASDGAAYERFLGRWSKRLARPFADFARPPEDGRALDVGCGTGALLEALKKRGCAQVFGLEYSDAALTYCRERGLEVRQFDLERDQFCDDRTFDVAISMEVAEHLPARMADTYIELINQLSDRIVFTAATPGQGGDDHVNEQPHSYWIAKFNARGFAYDAERSARWQAEWYERDIAECYAKNVMLFRRTM